MLTGDGTNAQLAYFLKSVLKSPKAAPELAVVGVLSWPASTAASAPPWSLYKTPVDMLSAKQSTQEVNLYSAPLPIYKLRINVKICLCNVACKVPAKRNFSEISPNFSHAEAEVWAGQVGVTWQGFSCRRHIDLH